MIYCYLTTKILYMPLVDRQWELSNSLMLWRLLYWYFSLVITYFYKLVSDNNQCKCSGPDLTKHLLAQKWNIVKMYFTLVLISLMQSGDNHVHIISTAVTCGKCDMIWPLFLARMMCILYQICIMNLCTLHEICPDLVYSIKEVLHKRQCCTCRGKQVQNIN